jgi:hypothetical protein
LISSDQEKALDSQFKQAAVRRFLKQGFKSKEGLQALLIALNITASSKCICGKSDHCAPQDFLFETLTGLVNDYIVWANRAGSKSYLGGFKTWFHSSNKPRLETCILGGSESQSEKSYKAINDFWYESGLQSEFLTKDPMISKTEWINGSTVSILTASQRSVRGPHPQHLILDEVDEMDWAILEAALSQPQTKYGISPSIGIYSTNHNVAGTMDKIIEQSSTTGGFKVYKWCIWESLESCKDFSCSTCKLSSFCPGQQMKQADGYYKIADFIKKLETISNDALQREWFCNKIGRGDLVYGAEFDEHTHIVRIPFNPQKEVYLSIDWGGVNPFSVGAWQFVPEYGWVRVDEVYKGNSTNQLLMKECKLRPWWKNVWGAVADPARADLIKEWTDAGIQVTPADNDVDSGVESVKAALKPVLGMPKIAVSVACKDAIREFNSYHTKNGKIVKESDHAMDEIRYFVRWKVALIGNDSGNRPRQRLVTGGAY